MRKFCKIMRILQNFVVQQWWIADLKLSCMYRVLIFLGLCMYRYTRYTTFLCILFRTLIPTIDYGAVIFTNTNKRVERIIQKVLQHIFTRRLFSRLYPATEIPDYNERLRAFSLSLSLSHLLKQFYKIRS